MCKFEGQSSDDNREAKCLVNFYSRQKNVLMSDLWSAEPCFEMRSLQVLRSSTLLPSVLRADCTSEFCEPPPCPGATGGEEGEKSSPESSVCYRRNGKGGLRKFSGF